MGASRYGHHATQLALRSMHAEHACLMLLHPETLRRHDSRPQHPSVRSAVKSAVCMPIMHALRPPQFTRLHWHVADFKRGNPSQAGEVDLVDLSDAGILSVQV